MTTTKTSLALAAAVVFGAVAFATAPASADGPGPNFQRFADQDDYYGPPRGCRVWDRWAHRWVWDCGPGPSYYAEPDPYYYGYNYGPPIVGFSFGFGDYDRDWHHRRHY